MEARDRAQRFQPRATDAPYRIWGSHLEPDAVQQLKNACKLPVAVSGALMPDAHFGYGLPIGGRRAVRGGVHVHPGAAGRLRFSCGCSAPDLDDATGHRRVRRRRGVARRARRRRCMAGDCWSLRRRGHRHCAHGRRARVAPLRPGAERSDAGRPLLRPIPVGNCQHECRPAARLGEGLGGGDQHGRRRFVARD